MPWFRCFMRGENFPGPLLSETGLIGFYITRFVEAENAEGAEAGALESLRDEPKLALARDHVDSCEPRVFFEQIEELAQEEVPAIQPGFAFYPMDADGTD